MPKYPYFLERVERNGTRDNCFIKVLSTSRYTEIANFHGDLSISQNTTLRKSNTDKIFKEQGSDKKWRLEKDFMEMSESKWKEKLHIALECISGEKVILSGKPKKNELDIAKFLIKFEENQKSFMGKFIQKNINFEPETKI